MMKGHRQQEFILETQRQNMPYCAIQNAVCLLLLLALLVTNPAHADTIAVPTRDGEEIPVSIHPAKGGRLFIWLPSEAGPQTADTTLAEQLTRQGNEVWRVDLLEARFLPLADSSLLQVPAPDIGAVLNRALQTRDKQIFIIANGRSAIPLLRGVRDWQRDNNDTRRFAGVILVSPKLFVETPEPGEEARLLPIVTASNVPMYWLQPDQSPWYWKLPQMISALESGGSDVFVRVLHGVRDRFYFRPDANTAENALREKLPTLLISAATALSSVAHKRRQAVTIASPSPAISAGKKANTLKAYKGDPNAPPLRLENLSKKIISLADYRGRVVLVNFWASWCPPCVHEMPSMQRLADGLSDKPFEILAVNMAESPVVIREFLQTRVNVDFPILLDRDGAALKRWQVFAFPTSFVIDKSGRIRFGLFGATEWDSPEIVQKIQQLLRE